MATLYEGYSVGDDGGDSIYGGYWTGQTFTVGATAHNITSVKLKMYRTGSPGPLIVSIRATGGDGKPTGKDLTSGMTNANLFTTIAPGQLYEIAVTEYTPSPNTKYVIIARILGGDWANCVYYRSDSSSPTYAYGNWLASGNSGSSWGAYTGVDMMFEVWGSPWPYGKVTVIGTAKGGFPIPSMRLEVYQDNILVGYGETPSSELQLNVPYQTSYDIVTRGDHTFYGKMILTNPLKQMVYGSQVKSVTLQPAAPALEYYPFTIKTIDTTTGNPVPEASGAMIGPATYSGVTDSTGTYIVPLLIPGVYDIHITKLGYRNHDLYGASCGGPGAGYTAGLIPS